MKPPTPALPAFYQANQQNPRAESDASFARRYLLVAAILILFGVLFNQLGNLGQNTVSPATSPAPTTEITPHPQAT